MKNVVSMPDAREQIAREAFANHVQNVAFNLTLSRSMIGVLHVIRDCPPSVATFRDDDKYNDMRQLRQLGGPRVDSHWVPLARAVERRGLVVHCPLPPGKKHHECPGHLFYRLTRAGELVCDLLVEAGLLPAAEPKPAKRKRTA